MGDALWALPTIRLLCEQHEAKADFYTSTVCLPMRDLMEAQDCIAGFVVPSSYQISSATMGVQPHVMDVDAEGYEKVYHLGFHAFPDRCIGEWIAYHAGLEMELGAKDIHYDNIPKFRAKHAPWKEDYVALATRGRSGYVELFKDFARHCPLPCLEIGAPDQFIGAGINCTSVSMLEMASVIAGAKAFVGMTSAPLVIANGFPIKRIVAHGSDANLHHLLKSDLNHYLLDPIAEELLDLI